MTVTEFVLIVAAMVGPFVSAPVAYRVGRFVRQDKLNAAYTQGWADGSVAAGKRAAELWGPDVHS